MKNTRRARRIRGLFLSVACIALVAGLAIGGTIAWLIDTDDPVTNTFTPSNIGVELEETVPQDKTAQMVPGATINKDPKVTINNPDVDAYVFVKITESTDPDLDKYISYSVASGWNLVDGYAEDMDEKVYYRLVNNDAEVKEFSVLAGDKVTVNSGVTNADMTAIASKRPTLKFEAFAIQAENLTVNKIDDIWELASGT